MDLAVHNHMTSTVQACLEMLLEGKYISQSAGWIMRERRKVYPKRLGQQGIHCQSWVNEQASSTPVRSRGEAFPQHYWQWCRGKSRTKCDIRFGCLWALGLPEYFKNQLYSLRLCKLSSPQKRCESIVYLIMEKHTVNMQKQRFIDIL